MVANQFVEFFNNKKINGVPILKTETPNSGIASITAVSYTHLRAHET